MKLNETELKEFNFKYESLKNIFKAFSSRNLINKKEVINCFSPKELYAENTRDAIFDIISHYTLSVFYNFFPSGQCAYGSENCTWLSKYNPVIYVFFRNLGTIDIELCDELYEIIDSVTKDVRMIMDQETPDTIEEMNHKFTQRAVARKYADCIKLICNTKKRTNPDFDADTFSIEHFIQSGILKVLDFKKYDEDKIDIKRLIDSAVNKIIQTSASVETIVSLHEQFPNYIGFMFAIFNPNKEVLRDEKIQKIIREEYTKHERTIQQSFFDALWTTRSSEPFENLLNILVYENSRVRKVAETDRVAKIISTFLCTYTKDSPDYRWRAGHDLAGDAEVFIDKSIVPVFKKHPEVANESSFVKIFSRAGSSVVRAQTPKFLGYLFYKYLISENKFDELCKRVRKNPVFYKEILYHEILTRTPSALTVHSEHALQIAMCGLQVSVLCEDLNISYRPSEKFIKILEAYASEKKSSNTWLALTEISDRYEELKAFIHPFFMDAVVDTLHIMLRYYTNRFLTQSVRTPGSYGRTATAYREADNFSFAAYNGTIIKLQSDVDISKYIELWKNLPNIYWDKWSENSKIQESDSFKHSLEYSVIVKRFNAGFPIDDEEIASPYHTHLHRKTRDGSLFSAIFVNIILAAVDRYMSWHNVGSDISRFALAYLIAEISSEYAKGKMREVTETIISPTTAFSLKEFYVDLFTSEEGSYTKNRFDRSYISVPHNRDILSEHPKVIECKKEYSDDGRIPFPIKVHLAFKIHSDLIQLYTGNMPEVDAAMDDIGMFVSSMVME